jgi:hypothetical protein
MYLSGREAFGKSECEGGSGLIFKFMAWFFYFLFNLRAWHNCFLMYEAKVQILQNCLCGIINTRDEPTFCLLNYLLYELLAVQIQGFNAGNKLLHTYIFISIHGSLYISGNSVLLYTMLNQ